MAIGPDIDATDLFEPRDRIEEALRAALACFDGSDGTLRAAMEYSALGGGKRLRPLLAWHCARACGGSGEESLPSGVALEMVHAFSLVHDDLPAMDDDDLRRGKPTLHKHAGEAMAILAGDALLNLAHEHVASVYLSAEGNSESDELRGLRLVRELGGATSRMIVGQVQDTLGGLDRLDAGARLERIHRNKTGALLRAASRMGAISAGGSDADVERLSGFADAAGLMFQIVDDLIDVEQSAEHAGKATGKDAQAGKLTYPGVHGVEASRAKVLELLEEAQEAVEPFGDKGEPLARFVAYLSGRTR